MQKTYAVLGIARRLLEGRRFTVQQGIVLVYADTDEAAAVEADREVLKLFPESEGWDAHQSMAKDISVNVPPSVKGGFLHLYVIFAYRKEEGDSFQIRQGLTHQVTDNPKPELEHQLLAHLITTCPESQGWRGHNIRSMTKQALFDFIDLPSRPVD